MAKVLLINPSYGGTRVGIFNPVPPKLDIGGGGGPHVSALPVEGMNEPTKASGPKAPMTNCSRS